MYTLNLHRLCHFGTKCAPAFNSNNRKWNKRRVQFCPSQNVFLIQITLKTVIEIQNAFRKLVKYKLHTIYFEFIFQLIFFQILHDTAGHYVDCRSVGRANTTACSQCHCGLQPPVCCLSPPLCVFATVPMFMLGGWLINFSHCCWEAGVSLLSTSWRLCDLKKWKVILFVSFLSLPPTDCRQMSVEKAEIHTYMCTYVCILVHCLFCGC